MSGPEAVGPPGLEHGRRGHEGDRLHRHAEASALLNRLAAALADRYAVERELGRGGMAAVFLARDMQLDRLVALKVLHAELAAAVGGARFAREIRLTARLQHPHIVPVLAAGEAAGLPYFVMPYVEGESLRDRLRREQCLTLNGALAILTQVGSALEYAHELGIVHRDVKPENVLMDRIGNALVADFGIARAVGDAIGETLTLTGTALGTPTYMSPEQAVGDRPLDRRSDVYSVACVLYEMLAGNPPYTADTQLALIGRHYAAPIPSIRHVRADVPPQIDAAIQRALAKDPAERFSSIAEFLDACRLPVEVATGADSRQAPSVAVLDFINDGTDRSLDWLGSAIAESVADGLKRVSAVRSIGRDRVMRMVNLRPAAAGSTAEAIAVGRRLGATWVACGTYHTHGSGHLSVTPRLGRTEGNELPPLERIDGTLDDVFALRERVVRSLVAPFDEDAAHQVEAIHRTQTKTVSAYEAFARGRQLFRRFGPASFTEARTNFEQAIAADSSYALAYSGLGSIFAFRYIATGAVVDLEIAVANLERALELDPELGEAYLWLGYAYLRQHRFTHAEECLRKARELEPDNPFSFYFSAARGTLYPVPDLSWQQRIPHAAANLLRAIELEPSFQVAYMNAATLYLDAGQYASARRFLDRALQIEQTVKSRDVRFVGALTMRAVLHAREGDTETASTMLSEAANQYRNADHVYAPQFTVSSRNGLAEIAASKRDFDLAVEHYTAACELCDARPAGVGMGLLLLRARIGLAKAFRALNMRRDEQQQLSRVASLLRGEGAYSFEWVWMAARAHVQYDLASCHAAAGRLADALSALDAAIDLDWGDLSQLANDESFARLRRDGALDSRMQRVRERGSLPEPGPEFWSATENL